MLITLLITLPQRASVKGLNQSFGQELRETACTIHGRTEAGRTQLPSGVTFRPRRYILASILGIYGVKGTTFKAEFTLGRFIAFYTCVNCAKCIKYRFDYWTVKLHNEQRCQLANGEQYADAHILNLLFNDIGICRRRHKNYIQQNLRGLVSSSSGHYDNYYELILLIDCLLGL